MKKTLSLLLVAVMLFSFASCQSTVEPKKEEKKEEQTTKAPEKKEEAKKEEKKEEEPKEAERLYIPVISKGFQHQFWQAVKLGAEQAAADYDVDITFEGPESEAMVDKQIEMLEVALSKNPAALCLAALDSTAEVPYVQKATDAGIPVVGFDSGVDSDLIVATAATDNYAAAAHAADKMAELIGEEGKVGVIAHDQTSTTGIQRRDGFVDTMKDKYPNIEVVDIQYAEGDHLKSTEAAKAMLQAYPDLKGIFGTNEGSAVGCANAVAELGNAGELVVVGFDSGSLQMEAIRDGRMAGAITQNPVGIGYKAVEAAVKAVKGESLDTVIDTGYYWYDKTNIDDEKIQAVLYE